LNTLGWPYDFDVQVLQTIHKSVPSGFEPMMDAITTLGSVRVLGGWVVIALLILIRQRRWKSALLVFAAGLLTPLLIEGLKLAFHRTRPELWPRFPDASYSFPSGHALGSVVVYGVLIYLIGRTWPRWRPVLWRLYLILVVMIGFSRLYLGLHWPTDVIGSWVAGAVLLFSLIYWHEERYRADVAG